jgi:hypothetical protein
MKVEVGNMWTVWGKTDLWMFTSNPIRNRYGGIVMGAGIAKQVAQRFPYVPRGFRDVLDKNPASAGVLSICDGQLLGYFMVKHHWELPADLGVISDSVADLKVLASRYDRIDLNYPGIGNGRLKESEVEPVIISLPDNVHVWKLPNRSNLEHNWSDSHEL